MARMRYVNKEKIVCIAAATLLAITAHAIIAGAMRQKPLPGRPTVGGVRLRRADELEVGPKDFAGFWNFGERNPFQPVIDPAETVDHDAAQEEAGVAGGGADHDDAAVLDRNHQDVPDQDIGNDNIDPEKPDQADLEAEHENEIDLARAGLDMPLTLEGTIKVHRRRALLQDKQTGLLTQCAVGDTIRGMNVMGVFPTSVIVQDKSGKLHELTDAFRRKYE